MLFLQENIQFFLLSITYDLFRPGRYLAPDFEKREEPPGDFLRPVDGEVLRRPGLRPRFLRSGFL